MAFKKHDFTKYSRQGMVGYFQLFDENNRRLDYWKWNISDKESERRIFTIMKNAYGVFRKPSNFNNNSG